MENLRMFITDENWKEINENQLRNLFLVTQLIGVEIIGLAGEYFSIFTFGSANLSF
jgi:hypothetical protein